ncbi:50S ribosomal protein L9 [Hoylesella buccalis]|uniref:50S ribosomal protein L9 n=1 Tax=Hoylesella buccalis TaxID=28127 RepID=UPI001D08559A|nr:50S ribosomal protein L9 [Hoylesella buccalis]MCB6900926.1 50S ribosomal protein L9 [Hoylesella buccalis]UEA62633.1 50S ribosomal protein L9 [Hoylesella buccalis]UWP50081.1 50S ribosomal protein L9 [Hoylesella buccalis ATCC 35310]
MEIILKEDIIGLGYKNDIVNVKKGYGRNYLIPTGKAVIASESAKKVLAEDMRQQAHKLAALKAEAEKKAAALENVALEITAKVSASGVTYGSVTAATVAEELAKKGFDIDRKIVTMRDIKKVGDYEAVVHFHKEVEVKIPVKVVAENAPKEESAAETKKVSELAEEAANAEAPVAETEVTEEAEAPAAENAEEAAE